MPDAEVTILKPGMILTTDCGAPAPLRLWAAEGSYAHVFRATYGLNGTPCAVKAAKGTEESRELLRLQGDILARVSGPTVVRLLDRGAHGETPFLVLEWLEGGSLAELMDRRRRLPLREALDVSERIFTGLALFHRQGTPHGDLRAENVVLEARGAVLIDPHALAVGNVPAPSVETDLAAAGRLLARMLTGEARGELPPGAGHRSEVLRLWEQSAGAKVPAAQLAREAARVRGLL